MTTELSQSVSRLTAHSARSPGMSTVMAAVGIVVILVALSVGTFAVLGGFSPQPGTQCSPPSSPACGSYENLHDVSVLSPFKSAPTGAAVALSASVPQGESATSYTYNFGDGVTATTSGTIESHNYTNPGQYLVYVQASVSGLKHDNIGNLVLLKITPSATVGNAGSTAPITTSVVSNTTSPTAGTKGVTTVLTQGQSVTVSAAYSSAPTNPAFTTLPPKIIVSTGGTITTNSPTPTSVQATALFSAAGTFELTFVGSSTNVNGTQVVYQNYTWTVFVAASGTHAGIFGSAAPQSPHPGTIVAYELAPGGAASEDPAIDYETVGAEPISNIYQTLITYNGTDVGPAANNYVPVAATCVPGSPQCKALYGNTLQNGTSYTFVIQPNATFYDPTTQAHWSMFPTDVEFSIARDLGFSTLPFTTAHPGWIVAQALLNPGNVSWDLIHGSYNSTPQDIFASMVINGTQCPSVALKGPGARGCITFLANGDNHPWPDFLELVADPLGAGIVSCGWFSARAQAAGIPYWSRGNISGSGDQPCAPVGAGLGTPVAQIPATGWDQWEELGSGSFNGQYLGNVQWNLVGSGPYALSNYLIGSSYAMKANPYYEQNPYCTWTGCTPKAGQYASQVEVTWETSETQGEQALRFGAADFASIPSSSIGLMLQLIQQGKINAIQAPTLNIFFEAFNLNFNLPGAQRYSTNPIGVLADFFTYIGMREFISRAYPYATIENTINTKDGIQFGFNMGGAIPQFMGNYYPSNISWPSKDPCTSTTDPACPAYWWAQMHSSSSPFYDPQVLSCSSSNPCQFPIFSATGNTPQDEINSLWDSEISSLSGGALQSNPIDINFVNEVANSETVAGQNPMPIYSLGWAPDFPDPTDYTVPLYNPNATYTAGDAVATQLEQPQFATGCAYNFHQYSNYAALAVSTGIPQSCQGVAYKAMVYALGLASAMTNLTQRQATYDLAEQIGYGLCLYVYQFQQNVVPQFSSWVDINSVDTNVMGSTGWFTLAGNGVQYAGST
ncbi:MAG: ABC transporter substrate-binding protein [Thermoplasmata archaeon]|nr:ABC transporter substrate-binding protein [Thermoplasmata archaeon]